MHILNKILLAYGQRISWLMKFVWAIPNANGGLHVGLCIEPTVSYSPEEKVKNAYKCLLVFAGRHLFFMGEAFGYNKKYYCRLWKADKDKYPDTIKQRRHYKIYI